MKTLQQFISFLRPQICYWTHNEPKGPTPVRIDTDTGTGDAFGRLRTAGTGQRIDVEFLYDKQPEFFDEITNNGTVTFNSNTRDLTLTTSDSYPGTYAEMRSHPVPYTPGNSQLIDITGTLNLANIPGYGLEFFLRTSISGTVEETIVSQDDWAIDASGIDASKSQIFSMDFQSLKVGRIRYYLSRSGLPVFVGQIVNDNLRDSGYWQIASLPVFWKIYHDYDYTYLECGYGNDENAIGFRYVIDANANATMKAICVTVKSEGGINLQDLQGLPRSVDTGVTAITVGNTLIPLMSIRAKDTYNSYDNLIISLPKSYGIATDNPIRIVILENGTLTDPSWADVDTDRSSIEYDLSATAVTGGHAISSGFINTDRNQAASGQGLLGKSVLWNRKGNLSGIITIAAVRTSTSDAAVYASLQWEEIL